MRRETIKSDSLDLSDSTKKNIVIRESIILKSSRETENIVPGERFFESLRQGKYASKL